MDTRTLQRGAALFDRGAHWAAHEVWEELWRAEPDPRRRTWLQGLIQVAAAFHKLVAKNDAASARRLLARGLDKLQAAGDVDPEMPTSDFVARTRACADALARDERTAIPRLIARRAFVLVGQTASASPDFSLDDMPSTSGRLDVLVRCLRSALLVSHGVRRDAVVYLILLGGARAPRCLRVEGATARFLRPDERSLATVVKKALAADAAGSGFLTVRQGIAVAEGGLEAVLADLGPSSFYVLEEQSQDVREAGLDAQSPVFFIGDHHGFDAPTRARLVAVGAKPISIGPVSVHADDAIAVLSNELDRARRR